MIDTALNWTNAVNQAKATNVLGAVGHLAVITSQEERAFVDTLVSSTKSYWIGSSNINPQREWRWTAGPELNAPVLPFWASMEPNETSTSCMAYRALLMYDSPCATLLSYIVEYQCKSWPVNDSLLMYLHSVFVDVRPDLMLAFL